MYSACYVKELYTETGFVDLSILCHISDFVNNLFLHFFMSDCSEWQFVDPLAYFKISNRFYLRLSLSKIAVNDYNHLLFAVMTGLTHLGCL